MQVLRQEIGAAAELRSRPNKKDPMSLVSVTRPADGVLLVQINRPEARNALSRETIHQLASEFSAAASDDSVRLTVLAGTESVFSAGADIKEFVAEGGKVLEDNQRRADWSAIERFPKPIVAAVEGYAFGGGFELMLLADIVVMAENARVACPEINIGLIPGDGGTQRITRVAGKAMASLLMMTGEPIDAETAIRSGLVSKLSAPGQALDEAMEVARRLATRPPLALRFAKATIAAAYQTSLTGGLEFEHQAILRAFATEDRVEGTAAFKEKRPPVFRGR